MIRLKDKVLYYNYHNPYYFSVLFTNLILLYFFHQLSAMWQTVNPVQHQTDAPFAIRDLILIQISTAFVSFSFKY